MAFVPMGDVATAALEQVAPLGTQDAAHSDVLANLVAALNAPIENVATWVSDTDTEVGYSILLDVDRAPAIALPWLGQMKGVRVTAGLLEADQRDEIRHAEGLRRGSIAALEAAARMTLTGARTVRVLTRVGGDMYAVTVITRTAETPDPDLTLARLMAAKRIGVILTHVVTDDVIWVEATVTWADVDSGVTWADVELADVT
jgi:hypothetical protein